MWSKIESQYKQLNKRERVLLLLAGLSLIFSGGWFLIGEPMLLENNKIQQAIDSATRENNDLQKQITMLQRSLRGDPNSALREELELAKGMTEDAKDDLLNKHNLVVESKTMGLLLGDVFKKAKSVKVKSLQTSAPETIVIGKNDGAVSLYKHQVILTVSGSFDNMVAFIAQLKEIPYTIYWQRFDYDATKHPASEMEIEFYTVSLEKDVISV